MKALRCGLLILLGILASSQISFAYIPPSEFILRTWIKKHSSLSKARMHWNVKELKEGKETGVQFNEVTDLETSQDSACLRSSVQEASGQKVFETQHALGESSLVARLLLSVELSSLVKALQGQSIPIRSTEEILHLKTEKQRREIEEQSFMRSGEHIAWVIGKAEKLEAPELGKLEKFGKNAQLWPQIWFEKDSFFPLRLVFKGKEGGLYDVRFDHFHFFQDVPFPRELILVKRGEGVVLKAQLTDLTMNTERAKSAQKANEGQCHASGFTAYGNSQSGPVKELIQQYYDVFK